MVLAVAVLAATAPFGQVDADFGTAQQVGQSLFGTYVLPFELASIILLVGMIAAVVLGRRQSGEEPR